LWSSKSEQLEYNELDQNTEVSTELFLQWNDFYTPGEEIMKDAFSAD